MTAADSTPVRHELLTAPLEGQAVERVKMLRPPDRPPGVTSIPVSSSAWC